jgi:hypothetical protein
MFIGEALACWLSSNADLGISLGEHLRLVSLHYADDTQVFLPDLEAPRVTTLVSHLLRFGSATGQHVNAGKSAILPIGTIPVVGLPAAVAGIPVATSVTALGVPHSNPPLPPAWPALPMGSVLRSVNRPPPDTPQEPIVSAFWDRKQNQFTRGAMQLCKLPLSSMGRGTQLSAYATSTCLFHAEFTSVPDRNLRQIAHCLQRAVDGTWPHRGGTA